jgi:hypothetical protein
MNGITSVLLSVVAGGVGGVATRVVFSWYRDRKSRRRLRESIYEEVGTNADEIEGMAHSLEVVKPHGDAVRVPPDTLVTTVYESNAESLGLLPKREANAIVEFYTDCYRVRRILAEIDDTDNVDSSTAMYLRSAAIELHRETEELLDTMEEQIEPDDPASRKLETIPTEDRYESRPPSEMFSQRDTTDDTEVEERSNVDTNVNRESENSGENPTGR